MMHWTFIFFGSVLLLFLLPLAPALLEWRRRTDDKPLKVVREYDGNIKYFSIRFRHFLSENFSDFMNDPRSSNVSTKGTLAAGDSYQIVGFEGEPNFTANQLAAKATSQIILGRSSLHISDGMFFEKELYASDEIVSGNKNAFRALLAERDIRLGNHCDIIRWAHSYGNISLGTHARLYGRISADGEIQLQQQSRFGRMYARVIRFGQSEQRNIPDDKTSSKLNDFPIPEKMIDQAPDRWLMAGSVDIPANTFHRGSLVAQKNLTLGSHSHIAGGIKSKGDLRLGAHSHIQGAIVATGNMYIGPGCTIKGPVVCERMIFIETGTIIGTEDQPTTITASEIRVEEGVTAYGAVWARELGFVSQKRNIVQ
jgi:cytoskeletal protein CcmA (bactofilin family)